MIEEAEHDTVVIEMEPLSDDDVGVTSTFIREAIEEHPGIPDDVDFEIRKVERKTRRRCPECGSTEITAGYNEWTAQFEYDCLECGHTEPVERPFVTDLDTEG